MQSYHLALSHVYPPSIVFASLSFTGLWPVTLWSLIPVTLKHTQTLTSQSVFVCVSVSSSEPEEVAIWKEVSSSCLVSFFVL